jgi:hypothetical protein
MTPQEKESLYEIYSSYKRCNNKFYDNKEDIIADKKEIISHYITYFPELAQKGITIDHLPEILYTRNQIIFLQDMEDHFDFEINYKDCFNYDWADIDGDICPSVIVKDLSIFLDRYHKYCLPFNVFDFNNDKYITLYISRASVVIERNHKEEEEEEDYKIFAR